MKNNEPILKAVDPQGGEGFPKKPEPFTEGATPPNPENRETSPQTLSLTQAAQKNFIKQVQNPSTGNINFVINHGRLHSNGYRLLKEGKEVRSRVISAQKESKYVIEADPKLVGSSPSTVKDDFAADPSNPEFRAQAPSTTAIEDAELYLQDLVDQGLLGRNVDQKSLQKYAQAIAGTLPVQDDGTNPNDITVENLRKKIEENSGSEIASALFNIDPDDPEHVDIDSFIKQIRKKQQQENNNNNGKPKQPRESKEADKATLEEVAREVLPTGILVFGIKNIQDFRSQRARFVGSGILQTYESMANNFVQKMLAVHLKHIGIPVSNVEDFMNAISSKDSVGNYSYFEFVKESYMKLGYSASDAGKKAEYFLNLLADTETNQFYLISASGINLNLLSAVNLYKQIDGSVDAAQLYANSVAQTAAEGEPEKPEDPQELEREKSVRLKQSLHKPFLTDEEMEYGILHILQKPIGYKYLTLDIDRVENLEEHISKKTLLALKNDGLLEVFFQALAKVENISTAEIYGRFDIQPSTLKNIDLEIESAKNFLFDVIKQTPTGPKIDPEKYAEHVLAMHLAKLRVQVLQDIKSMGMKSSNFEKEKILEIIDIRNKVKLLSKSKGLLDWANGDIQPEKDYPLVTDSGIAERQQQLAHVFAKPSDFKNASYEKIKELHKQMFMVGTDIRQQSPTEQGKTVPKARDDELTAEIANSVEGALQGKDLNILKLSKDLVYEINNSYIEMIQIKDSPTELEAKRNSLEKFLNSRGLTPAGAKSAADAVLSVVKGEHTGGLPVGSGSSRPQQPSTNVPPEPSEQANAPSIDKIIQRLESKGIRKIPKGVQSNIERLKTYLDVNDVQLSEAEIQTLFTHFNPPPPQFSFEEYAKRNPNRFINRGDKFYIKIGDKEIPVPENLKGSEQDLMGFVKENEDRENEVKAKKIEQAKEKIMATIGRIDTVAKLKRQDKKQLIQQLVEAGMSEAEASLLIENAIAEKIPALQAKNQAKLKGLENSAKVRNIFTSDGKSLSSQEIAANLSVLAQAVSSEISDYFIDDREAFETAEKIVAAKYREAVQREKLSDLEEKLGIKQQDGKSASSGELDLAINRVPTKVKVKKTDEGYVLSANGAELRIPKEQLIESGTVNYDQIAQQLESMMPAVEKKSGKKSTSEAETAGISSETSNQNNGSIPVKVQEGRLEDAKAVASGILGSILSGRPIKLSTSLAGLDEDSWMALSDAISKSKTFKKLKLNPSVADDIVFRLTSAEPDELEFNLADILQGEQSPKNIEYDEFGNVIRKSLFGAWSDFLTKNLGIPKDATKAESTESELPDEEKKIFSNQQEQLPVDQTSEVGVEQEDRLSTMPSINVSTSSVLTPTAQVAEVRTDTSVNQQPSIHTAVQPNQREVDHSSLVDTSAQATIEPEKSSNESEEASVSEVLKRYMSEQSLPIDAAPKAFEEVSQIPRFKQAYGSLSFTDASFLDKPYQEEFVKSLDAREGSASFFNALQSEAPSFLRVITTKESELIHWLLKGRPINGVTFGAITPPEQYRAGYTQREIVKSIMDLTANTAGVAWFVGSGMPASISIRPPKQGSLNRWSSEDTLGTYFAGQSFTAGDIGTLTTEDRMKSTFYHEYAHVIHSEIISAGFKDLTEPGRVYSPEDTRELRDLYITINEMYKKTKEQTLEAMLQNPVIAKEMDEAVRSKIEAWKSQPTINIEELMEVTGLISSAFRKSTRLSGDRQIKLHNVTAMYGLANPLEWFAENFSVYMRDQEKFAKQFPDVYPLMRRVTEFVISKIPESERAQASEILKTQFGIG